MNRQNETSQPTRQMLGRQITDYFVRQGEAPIAESPIKKALNVSSAVPSAINLATFGISLVSSGLGAYASLQETSLKRDMWNRDWKAAHDMGLASPAQITSMPYANMYGRSSVNIPRGGSSSSPFN